ncbi:RWP-RK domain-containing protein [Chloropicon primus]|uniref:RWP-RK domain-containing protein n=1 Tax=Chloropicon primus TaxID=1764295 RepID=A0A5B8MYI2_9CHLO|nr:hypothetical protein A3770_14p71900 [Chloropicon primus]UPR03880.1 RWP-RK domain-containing protein [Chloropicon primus]|eukprot:QDZ24672.1 hypothetical protein A3770_14p71900 [Chloropicon primus]
MGAESAKGNEKGSSMPIDVLRDIFRFTPDKAALKLGISKRTLEERCVELGVKHWPGDESESDSETSGSSSSEECTDAEDKPSNKRKGVGTDITGHGDGPEPESQRPRVPSKEDLLDDKEKEAKMHAHVKNLLPLLLGFEIDLKEERARRFSERKGIKKAMADICKKTSDKRLLEEFQNFKKCIYATVDIADRMLEDKDMDEILPVLSELEARALKNVGVNEPAPPSAGDPKYEKHVAVLCRYIDHKMAKELIRSHKTLSQNVYNNSVMMSYWLAGLGYERLDLSNGFKQGVKKLQGEIERKELHAMAAFGRLLKMHGLEAPPHHFKRAVYNMEDDTEEVKFKALVKSLYNPPEIDEGRPRHQALETKAAQKLAEHVRSMRDRHGTDQVIESAKKYQKMETSDLFEIFKETFAKFKKDGRMVLSNLPTVELRSIVKLVEEVKMRIMHLGGHFKGEGMFFAGSELLEHYIPVLTMKLGPKAAQLLLRFHMMDQFSLYAHASSMATWLVGLGYSRDHWTSLSVAIKELMPEIENGVFDPMPTFAHLLEVHDLPWPPHHFKKCMYRYKCEGSE